MGNDTGLAIGGDRWAALRALAGREQGRHRTASDLVSAALRQAILEGHFQPGEWLRQDRLAEVLGTSRMPVREALAQLESEGLVALHPHRGAVVTALTPEMVREIYTVRRLLEGHALTEAIAAMTPERLHRLEALAAELDRAEAGTRFLELRLAFYRELYDADRHPLLFSLIERLRGDVGRYLLQRRVVGAEETAHTELIRYARARDPAGALTWLTTHLQRVSDELAKLVGTEPSPFRLPR